MILRQLLKLLLQYRDELAGIVSAYSFAKWLFLEIIQGYSFGSSFYSNDSKFVLLGPSLLTNFIN